MELEGNLKVFKLPDILQFLGQGRMTGLLSLAQGDKEVTLSFKEGKIVGSSSTARSVRLGEMLLYAGVLTRQRLQDFLDEQATATNEQYLGKLLVTQGILSEEDLIPYLELQVKEEIWDIFNWEEGSFRFEQGSPRVLGPIEIRLDIEPLLLEGTRRVDEWHSIQSSIGEGSDVFRANPEFSEDGKPALDPNAWRVLSLINGRLSVDAIARISNLGKFDTYWSLSQLLNAGLVVAVSAKVVSAPEPAETGSDAHAQAADAQGSGSSEQDASRSPAVGPLTDLLNRLGLKKIRPRNPEMIDDAANGSRPARPKRNRTEAWPSDVSLVCEAVNQLIDELAKGSKAFPKHSLGAQLEESWRESEERHPRADILKLRGDRISASLYERYAVLEKDVSDAIRGCHDDCLVALKDFWDGLIAKVADSDDRNDAEQTADRILKSLVGQSVTIASPEFSIARWSTHET